MTEDQFKSLYKKPEETVFCIPATCFTKDLTDRTLLYGYTIERLTHHVYLLNGFVQRYDLANEEQEWKRVNNFSSYDELVPNKRLYPEYCDYDFCVYLHSEGVYLPFTKYSPRKHNKLLCAVVYGKNKDHD